MFCITAAAAATRGLRCDELCCGGKGGYKKENAPRRCLFISPYDRVALSIFGAESAAR